MPAVADDGGDAGRRDREDRDDQQEEEKKPTLSLATAVQERRPWSQQWHVGVCPRAW